MRIPLVLSVVILSAVVFTKDIALMPVLWCISCVACIILSVSIKLLAGRNSVLTYLTEKEFFGELAACCLIGGFISTLVLLYTELCRIL